MKSNSGKKAHKNGKQLGFSVIELIVAMLLIAIISATVISRFNSPSSFDSSIARDNAIAMALLAQQAALGRENVSFEIDPEGDDWKFSVLVNGTELRSVIVPGTDLTMETGLSGTCVLALEDEITSNFKVTYDGTGNATGFTNTVSAPTPVGNGVRICINDDVDYSACISPAGFAHTGDCDA